MKTFIMIRGEDESGVSGIGQVLQGVVFDDGTTVVRWTVMDKPNSTAMYESFEAFKLIHVDSHPTNETRFIWTSPVASWIHPANDEQMKMFCQRTNCVAKTQKEVGLVFNDVEYYLTLCDSCLEELKSVIK